jgi:single-strand DNA-binding protein
MPELNQVTIAGRLTRDPDLRYTGSGMAVCNISVACDRYKGKDKPKESIFVRVTCWDKVAERVGGLSKGRPVLVEGRLTQDSWEDKDTGKKQTKTGVTAFKVTPLDWAESAPEQTTQPTETIPEDDIPF